MHSINPIAWTLVLLVGASLLFACGDASVTPTDAERARANGNPDTIFVEEKVDFTNERYDFSGPVSIQSLLSIIPEREFVWYGTGPDDPPPFDMDGAGFVCGERNSVVTVPQLPVVIEGIVTLQPRYFQKTSFCDSDERFYGSYFLEDSTGGILILKESRIEDFYMGDRVRLRVRGLMKFFDTVAVLVSDEEEIISTDNPIYYRNISREFTEADANLVHRVTKKIAGVATNQNFNEMCLVDVDNPDLDNCAKPCAFNSDCTSGTCEFATQTAIAGTCAADEGQWLVSLDREIGQRQPRILSRGTVIQVTGPIVNSFGLKMLISRAGQIREVE